MIRVTVELIPHGDERRTRLLGSIDIVNVGGTMARGDYTVRRKGKRGQPVFKTGSVTNYPRLAKSFWYLIQQAIEAAHPKRK